MAEIYSLSAPSELLAGMREAQRALGLGELVVIPTDTVYGIAADAFKPSAVAALLEAKGRTRQSPPPVLVGSVATIDALASEVPDVIRTLLAEYAPGPLTVILPVQPSLNWDLGETNGTVALRVPNHPLTLELLQSTGPLAVSSANKHGQTAPATVQDAVAQLGEDVKIFLDAGEVGGEASTILDATGLTVRDNPIPARIVRHGALSRASIASVLGDLLEPEDAAN
ncbi:L-threonylcarbamoyladenylate synthase [Gulosibacter molinativorax]|uniref:L-threonylcarbamoyladenylate synthase n=1 Tax=Gulosibacter molinativorax TaxID=256821 RepID=A0ABT7C3R1_9MICO|nr:L-threonylcarbamoyladenylate synthase [Gulosibacter molinativorax]MDJ1369879.1 threonylcarbamoyl-AMP synthase [Gulosibacter molinativorax]QUY61844.1 Threonylcarbamoyl-AMP synthase [Gulosibacter molinativorax]